MGRRPAASDWLLALVFGAVMQIEVSFSDAPGGDVLVARAALLTQAVALAFRRQAPVICAAVGVGVAIVLERLHPAVEEDLVATFFATLTLCYSVGAYTERRQLWAGVAVLAFGSLAAIRLDRPPGGADDVLFAGTILVAGPVLLGRLVRSRVRLNQALQDKAAALEADRAARAADAVIEERERIAGELHHVVSEALASMVGQASTAEELSRSRPERAEAAFAAVEDTGREALGEIRRLLGVLRREDEELALAPQPSLTHLADLVARVDAAGLPVDLDVEGERPPLPAGLDLTAYRLVQEALGGALEAPDDRRAAVRVRFAEHELALEVTDVGESPPDGDRPLLGMRERVALYGGELVTERIGPGYAVRARLPLEQAA